tara:strand:+ start:634 stop:1647 length:1014 start_codon:yes stop_codon:yes gene_type:complete
MANAAFSPKDFKAWVVEETDTGNNAGALDAPAITSGLFQLDVDSVSFPSIAPNQVLDKRTSLGRVLHANDFYQDNVLRPTEVSLSGTYHNDTGHILLMQSVCGVDLQSTVADVVIPTASSTVSGLYGSGTEANKTFTLVLAPPDTTDGYNIVLVGCLCTSFSISADSTSEGGLYKWSATISTGCKPITNNTATEAGTVYSSAPISIATLTSATTINSITSTVLSSFNVTVDSPAVYSGVAATGFAAFARGAELSVTCSAQVKYDSVTRPLLNNFNTQSAHDAADFFTMTQATATDCSIAIGAGVLTNVALSEGDIMMVDVEGKAVNVGNDIISFNLA